MLILPQALLSAGVAAPGCIVAVYIVYWLVPRCEVRGKDAHHLVRMKGNFELVFVQQQPAGHHAACCSAGALASGCKAAV